MELACEVAALTEQVPRGYGCFVGEIGNAHVAVRVEIARGSRGRRDARSGGRDVIRFETGDGRERAGSACDGRGSACLGRGSCLNGVQSRSLFLAVETTLPLPGRMEDLYQLSQGSTERVRLLRECTSNG